MLRTLRLVPVVLLVAAGFISTACATQLYGQHGGYYRIGDQRAYDIGYREGLDHGRDDARRGRDYAYAHDREYRDADRGYDRPYGNREEYRRSFRAGYEAGYSDGYGGSHRDGNRRDYPTYPTYPTYPDRGVPRGSYSPATQTGFRDGFDAGRNDARDRRVYDPIRNKRYREGDHDYNNRYGSRDDYKREYRVAFEQGYRDGYGGARRF